MISRCAINPILFLLTKPFSVLLAEVAFLKEPNLTVCEKRVMQQRENIL